MQVLIRAPEAVVRKRREDRPYVTAGKSSLLGSRPKRRATHEYIEGEVWCDPPQYWEKVAWPAYIHAHQHLFENGDVVNGKLSENAGNLIMFEGAEVEMETMVNDVMKGVVEVSENVHL